MTELYPYKFKEIRRNQFITKEIPLNQGYYAVILFPDSDPVKLSSPQLVKLNFPTVTGSLETTSILGPKETGTRKITGDFVVLAVVFNKHNQAIAAIPVVQDGLSSGESEVYQQIFNTVLNKPWNDSHKYFFEKNPQLTDHFYSLDSDSLASAIAMAFWTNSENLLQTILNSYIDSLEATRDKCNPNEVIKAITQLQSQIVYARAMHSRQILSAFHKFEQWKPIWGDAIMAFSVIHCEQSPQEDNLRLTSCHSARSITDCFQTIETNISGHGLVRNALTVDTNARLEQLFLRLLEQGHFKDAVEARRVYLETLYGLKPGIYATVTNPVPDINVGIHQILALYQRHDLEVLSISRSPEGEWLRSVSFSDGATYDTRDLDRVSATEQQILDKSTEVRESPEDFVKHILESGARDDYSLIDVTSIHSYS